MFWRVVLLHLFLLSVVVFAEASEVEPRAADLVFHNGPVYRSDAARSWASVVAVEKGRIVYVGQQARGWIGPDTQVVDLEGKFLLPGFHDCHVHPVTGGLKLGNCILDEAKTPEAIAETIEEYLKDNPEVPWVVGRGWTLPTFPEGQPTRELLDRLVPDRPAYLVSSDGHNAWVNSRALALAGIDASTEDPPHGRFEREPDGTPTGLVRETAMDLFQDHLPKVSLEATLDGLHRGLDLARSFGITTLHEAHATPDVLEAYRFMDQEGRLTARVVAALATEVGGGIEQVADLERIRADNQGKRLSPTAVKIFVDGVLEGHTAAVLEPYLGRDQDRGFLNFSPEDLSALVVALDAKGFQIHCHAIGDRGIRVALDAFEAALQANDPKDRRHHISHVQLIDPQDIPRFRQLGVMANIQGYWAHDDLFITELTEPFLGPERSRWLYPNRSLAEAGTVIVGGSDWSVSSMNPLDAIQVAVTRTDPEKVDGLPWIPEERMTLADMLAAYTSNAAYLGYLETKTGSIEVGKAADLVVLDRNLFEIPAQEIGQARVLMTFLDGKLIFESGSESDLTSQNSSTPPARSSLASKASTECCR